MYVLLFVIMIINMTYILTLIMVALKILHNIVDFFIVKETFVLNVFIIYFLHNINIKNEVFC